MFRNTYKLEVFWLIQPIYCLGARGKATNAPPQLVRGARRRRRRRQNVLFIFAIFPIKIISVEPSLRFQAAASKRLQNRFEYQIRMFALSKTL